MSVSPVLETDVVETVIVERPSFEKSNTGITALKSSGNVMVTELFPAILIVLEIVYSDLPTGFTPVILSVTLETVSADALKFSRTISKLTDVVGHNSYVTDDTLVFNVPSTRITLETPISWANERKPKKKKHKNAILLVKFFKMFFKK